MFQNLSLLGLLILIDQQQSTFITEISRSIPLPYLVMEMKKINMSGFLLNYMSFRGTAHGHLTCSMWGEMLWEAQDDDAKLLQLVVRLLDLAHGNKVCLPPSFVKNLQLQSPKIQGEEKGLEESVFHDVWQFDYMEQLKESC